MTANGMDRSVTGGSMIPTLDDGTLEDLYRWLESVPLSRPRRSFHRDFSDGVLAAEIVAHFLPRYVDLHGFMPASSTSLKKYNWETLNKKVLCHLELEISEELIASIVELRPGAVEYVLAQLRLKIEVAQAQGRFKPRRRNRSRSSGPASRNGSQLSLNNLHLDCESNGPSKATTPTINIGPNRTEAIRSARQAERRESARRREEADIRFAMSLPTDEKGTRQICEDLVPGRVVHGLQTELIGKAEQIANLQNRVKHLEATLKLKDERIETLTTRLDRLAQAFYAAQTKRAGAATPNSSDGDLKRWIPTAAGHPPANSANSASASPLHMMAANFRHLLGQIQCTSPLEAQITAESQAPPSASLPVGGDAASGGSLTGDSGLVSPVAANYEFTNHQQDGHTP